MPWILDLFEPASVIDVGCGSGEWGAVAQRAGIRTRGVDGHPVECAIDDFEQVSLLDGYDCTGWDLAICLEVAEHLPPRSAEPLVAGLAQANVVLFSAAHPGQGGVQHLNEQWGSWWGRVFAIHGMEGSSTIKWRFWNDREVREFYRENMLQFARNILTPGIVDVIHPERLGTW